MTSLIRDAAIAILAAAIVVAVTPPEPEPAAKAVPDRVEPAPEPVRAPEPEMSAVHARIPTPEDPTSEPEPEVTTEAPEPSPEPERDEPATAREAEPSAEPEPAPVTVDHAATVRAFARTLPWQVESIGATFRVGCHPEKATCKAGTYDSRTRTVWIAKRAIHNRQVIAHEVAHALQFHGPHTMNEWQVTMIPWTDRGHETELSADCIAEMWGYPGGHYWDCPSGALEATRDLWLGRTSEPEPEPTTEEEPAVCRGLRGTMSEGGAIWEREGCSNWDVE